MSSSRFLIFKHKSLCKRCGRGPDDFHMLLEMSNTINPRKYFKRLAISETLDQTIVPIYIKYWKPTDFTNLGAFTSVIKTSKPKYYTPTTVISGDVSFTYTCPCGLTNWQVCDSQNRPHIRNKQARTSSRK